MSHRKESSFLEKPVCHGLLLKDASQDRLRVGESRPFGDFAATEIACAQNRLTATHGGFQ